MKTRLWLNQAHSSQRDVAALIRAGLTGGVEVISSHKHFREDIFMAADVAFIEPSFADGDGDAYVDWALETALSHRVKAMIAMRQRMALVRGRQRFSAAGIRVAAGATRVETIDLCDHKDQFTVAMAGLGIPVPATIAASTADELRAAIAAIEVEGEACVKPVLGVYGRGYWRFQRDKSLFDVFAGKVVHEIDPEIFIGAFAAAEAPRKLIVMEHLPGDEYSIDCVCDEGRLVAHAKRRKDAAYQHVSTGGPEAEIAEAIVGHLALDGLVNIQTRLDRHGRPKVLEVNTRPSGGIGYSAAAGINLPANAAQMLLGLPVSFRLLSEPVAVRIVEQAVALPAATERLRGVPAR